MDGVRIMVAEDEPAQRHALEELLRQVWPEATLAASCGDGLAALEAFEQLRPDVAFLDIRMPGISGLEVAEAMAGAAHVVFVTAYDDAAVRAFEQGAVDYLLKPIERDRLVRAVDRIQGRLSLPDASSLHAVVGKLRVPAEPGRSLRWVTATVRSTIKLYPIEEILAFHAQDKYTRVLVANDEAIIRTPLREILRAIDPCVFLHVHRSVIVRATAIDRVARDEAGRASLVLKGRPDVLPVSSAFYGRLRGGKELAF